MALTVTRETLFTKLLDTSLPGLESIDRIYLEKGSAAAEEVLAAYLRETLPVRARLYFSQPDNYIENAWRTSDESDEAVAERILAHKLMSCGVLHDFGAKKPIDWFFNPTYNGYQEWTWQLSRHHEWRLLARMYRRTKDERYVRGLVDLMSSYIASTECPESNVSGFATKAWRTIEIGIRLANNWPYTILSILNSPSVSASFLCDVISSLWENANRLVVSSTSHNWLIMEMNGLLHTSVLFPFFADAASWNELALRRLSEELENQLYPDHFQFELTTGYHGCVLMNYFTVMRFCKYMGIELPREFMRRVRDGFLMYIQLMQPDGKTVALNDGGRTSVAEQMEIASEFFADDPELLWAKSAGRLGKAPSYTSLLMPYSGMAVMRSGWGEGDSFAMLESAPFGKAHQHEDKLEVLLYAFGKSLLADPGSYAYDNSPMRRYILSSYSHNVALVDGKGQNRRAHYRWMPEDIRRLADISFTEKKDFEAAIGTYAEGFGDESVDVRHRRALIWLKKGCGSIHTPFYLVIDSFTSLDGRAHTYETLWHAPDNLHYTSNVSSVTYLYGDGVALQIVGDVTPRVAVGQSEPYMLGWQPIHATGDHEHLPTPTAVFAHPKRKDLKTPICLVPTKGEPSPIESVSIDGEELRIRLVGGAIETLSLKTYIPELF